MHFLAQSRRYGDSTSAVKGQSRPRPQRFPCRNPIQRLRAFLQRPTCAAPTRGRAPTEAHERSGRPGAADSGSGRPEDRATLDRPDCEQWIDGRWTGGRPDFRRKGSCILLLESSTFSGSRHRGKNTANTGYSGRKTHDRPDPYRITPSTSRPRSQALGVDDW